MFRYVGQAGSGPLMSNVRAHMKKDSDPSHAGELAGLPDWDHSFWLSRAFIEASGCLCTSMIEGEFSSQYSSSRVIIHLARQGVELFFKAALLAKGERVERFKHNLLDLFDAYRRCYPEPSYHIELPRRFQVAPTGDIFPDLLNEVHQTLDQRHRFASDRKGNTFATPEVFDPVAMREELQALDKELKVLEWVKIRPTL
jgi:hypothetical protein